VVRQHESGARQNAENAGRAHPQPGYQARRHVRFGRLRAQGPDAFGRSAHFSGNASPDRHRASGVRRQSALSRTPA
jgi:hypothetical protein